MYGAVKPAFGFGRYSGDMPDRDGFFNSIPEGTKTWLTVRDDDFYQYRHGHPDFARDYVLAMPREKVRGFYMGPDGYILGKEYIAQDGKIRFFTDKMWFNIAVWGRISYNPQYDDDYFYQIFISRYKGAGRDFYEAFKAVSDIIPELNRVHWHDLDFQWYPEGNVSAEKGRYLFFHSIRDFARSKGAPGSGYVGIGDYCSKLAGKEELKGILPPEASKNILNNAEKALKFISSSSERQGELKELQEDMHALALLGKFYHYKINAAIAYGMFKNTGDREYRKNAHELAQKSYESFVEYARKWSSLYKPQFLTRIQYPVDMIAFCEFAENDMAIVLEDN